MSIFRAVKKLIILNIHKKSHRNPLTCENTRHANVILSGDPVSKWVVTACAGEFDVTDLDDNLIVMRYTAC
jgi:hypothetical protein